MSNGIQCRVIWRCPAEPSQLANTGSEPSSVNNINKQLQVCKHQVDHTHKDGRLGLWLQEAFKCSETRWQADYLADSQSPNSMFTPPRAQLCAVCCRMSGVAFMLVFIYQPCQQLPKVSQTNVITFTEKCEIDLFTHKMHTWQIWKRSSLCKWEVFISFSFCPLSSESSGASWKPFGNCSSPYDGAGAHTPNIWAGGTQPLS